MGSLKAVASIFGALVALAAIGIAIFLWVGDHSAKNLAVKEQAVAGNATVAAAQAQQAAAAQQIVDRGEARARVDLEVHQANVQAIEAAPGAHAAIDPHVVDALDRGLCRHPAYAADPGCARLLEGNSAVVPSPGAGDAAPAF